MRNSLVDDKYFPLAHGGSAGEVYQAVEIGSVTNLLIGKRIAIPGKVGLAGVDGDGAAEYFFRPKIINIEGAFESCVGGTFKSNGLSAFWVKGIRVINYRKSQQKNY